MISKEDFNKVWKDSNREAILNQYYYDYMELQKVYSIIKEVREYIESYNLEYLHETNEHNLAYILEELLEILDKENNEQ